MARSAAPRAGTGTRRAAAAPTLRFDQRLVLFPWMLRQFGARAFGDLARDIKDTPEGFDEENRTYFFYALSPRARAGTGLTLDTLRGYDENIGRHWRQIAARRGEPDLRLKYFQYLMLLFTERYLDLYFQDPDRLRDSLNEWTQAFNRGVGSGDQVAEYSDENLNKLAFWSATGSGKTLIMHVNLAQYRHYLERAGRARELNRVILLTIGEDLSEQHIQDFKRSGIDAESFSKQGQGVFAGQTVEVIEVTKLRDEMGEKTVAVDAFEGNNLVFVDEGHRGSSGEEWKDRRDKLCARGFSFEYSATFGQAMQSAKKPELLQEYARCILFDYSYRYFHGDGYGKDFRILNLPENLAGETGEERRLLYLTGCLLTFYQQMRVYEERPADYAPFRLTRPLWVFVGGSVNAVRTENGRDTSDVLTILRFLAGFLNDPMLATERITRLLNATTPLIDQDGNDVFYNGFSYLARVGEHPGRMYQDVLRRVFRADAPGGLRVELLKGAGDEIALRVGQAEPFGVINVGDSARLLRLCEKQGELSTGEREFSASLFGEINTDASRISVLIGSKKFSAGWSSWRVGTMGLMNVGKSEGAEIIQLFGRGVRLQGLGFSLKRSDRIEGVTPPGFLGILETLNVFGVRADYMTEFKEDLKREGVTDDARAVSFILPVVSNLGGARLKTLRLRPGVDFLKDATRPRLDVPGAAVSISPVPLDWYVKVETAASAGVDAAADIAAREEGTLTPRHLAFLDWNALYLQIEQYKADKKWENFELSRDAIKALMANPVWYALTIPHEELAFGSFARVRQWQEIALALLKKYCDKYYKFRKNEYEMPQLEYTELSPDDPNLITEYKLSIDRSQTAILNHLEHIKTVLESGEFIGFANGNFEAIKFDHHLYSPLLFVKSSQIKVSPVSLNDGERDFVRDLSRFCSSRPEFFTGCTLYLLRNQSRGRGIGFFEAGNFYPDFLLWLVDGERQRVTFVDPKGIRNLNNIDDPKIQFFRTVKNLEARLNDPNVILDSFIVSNTDPAEINWLRGDVDKAALVAAHVLFQKEDRNTYVETLVTTILADR